MERVIRVPLAVDAQVRLPVGPMMLPFRALFLLAASSPLCWIALNVGSLSAMQRFSVVAGIMGVAVAGSAPTREGVWVGLFAIYRLLGRALPSVVSAEGPRVADVRMSGDVVSVTRERAPLRIGNRHLQRVLDVASIPNGRAVAAGLFELQPGGYRAVLSVEGPAMSTATADYIVWCARFIEWVLAADCPAQILTYVSHYDRQRAEVAFDRRISPRWPASRFLEDERELSGMIAGNSFGLQHLVVFAPLTAGPDGIPHRSRVDRFTKAVDTPFADAERVLGAAQRLASSFGVDVSVPDQEEVATILSQSILGARHAVAGEGFLTMGDQHQVTLTMTKLPPTIEVGTIVQALMRSQSRSVASLHIYPVDATVARKSVTSRSNMYKYAAKKGNADIDTEVAIQDANSVLVAIAQRSIKPCRVALTIGLQHPVREKALDAAERLEGILEGVGFQTRRATLPGFLPALAVAPGGTPLARGLQLTADSVAARMLPILGTPFSDSGRPLVGMNRLTGSPAYLSVWTRPNHNCVIVGSSGAGKSVATKTLLIRHAMEGAQIIVIDPDSEYERVMKAVRGTYVELGRDALNPLGAAVGMAPDNAASLVIPVLSVMGGDEKGIRDGRPIRRLPDEDQGWVHTEVAQFFRSWRAEHGEDFEPVLHDLVEYLRTEAYAHALTDQQRDRCHVIAARLSRYTQGQKAEIFDRPSSFKIGDQSVGIGLRSLALSYAADLTPALAIVLVSLLARLSQGRGRLLVVVDEAHRVTCDPDAGDVLGQLIRQARKYGSGVWMCSQRVEDFVETDLGRTLASTASTKLVLGVEEAARDAVAEVFRLRPEEMAALTPISPGRGVLISGQERTIVQVMPGKAIMHVANTTPADLLAPSSPAGTAARR